MFAVSVIYLPSINIKSFFWQWTPYSYKQALGFPNHLDKASQLNKSNRLLVLSFLNKSIYKDFLDINFWNYKQILESMDRDNIKEFEKTLPMKRLGEPEEIGNFVKSIIENKIKYLSGVTINFDGANSNHIF